MGMMSNLPQGWIKEKLPQVAKVIMGQSPPSSTYNINCDGLPFFQGKAEFGALYPSVIKYCNTPKKIAEAGDILISVRAPVGPTNLCKEKSCIGRGLAALRPNQVTTTKYLLYYMRDIESWLSTQGTGSTFTAISKTDLENVEILLAPLNEQYRIVAKLEKLLQKIDACKERLDKIPTILKRFRQSILAAACSGRLTADWREKNPDVKPASEPFNKNSREEKNTKNELPALDVSNLPELPHTWEWHRIVNLFKVVTGTTPPKKDKDNFSADKNDCPFFKPTDLNVGYLTEVSREYISKKGEKFCRILPPETVAVTSIGATIGKTGRLMIRSTTNQQINSILPTKNIIASYTFFYCNSEYFQKRIIEASSSTTLPIINKTRFGLLEYPLPPFAEQQEIVHRIEALFKIADQIEERYNKAKAYVDKLTQSILAKAFRGELVPQDLNDEPASELLKRVQEGKDRQTK